MANEITTAFNTAFRDFAIADMPASGANKPHKPEVRAIGPVIETELADVGDRVTDLENASPAKQPVPVRVLMTTNVAIATAMENGDILDGITLATGNVVVLAAQTTPAQNGAYVVPASGAAARSTAFDSSDELLRAAFYVSEGTHTGWVWFVRNTAAIVVGTDPITITQGYKVAITPPVVTTANLNAASPFSWVTDDQGGSMGYGDGVKVQRVDGSGVSRPDWVISAKSEFGLDFVKNRYWKNLPGSVQKSYGLVTDIISGASGVFARASTAPYTDSSGNPQTAGINVLRLDHDGSGNPLGYLTQPLNGPQAADALEFTRNSPSSYGVYAEAKIPATSADAAAKYLWNWGVSTTVYSGVFIINGTAFFRNRNSATDADIALGAALPGEILRICVIAANNGFVVFRDGVLMGRDTTVAMGANTVLAIGHFATGNTAQWNGHVRRIEVLTTPTEDEAAYWSTGAIGDDIPAAAEGAEDADHVPDIVYQTFNVRSSMDPTTHSAINCRVAYDRNRAYAPLCLFRSGWSQDYTQIVDDVLTRAVTNGYFAATLSKRGDGGGGARDASRREILDFVDQLHAIVATFSEYASQDGHNVFVGYSGGGGNAIALAAKSGDWFTEIISMFGMSNYATWHDTAPPSYPTEIEASMGGTPAAVPERYAANDHITAPAKNRHGGMLRLFHSPDDVNVPVTESRQLNNAYTAAGKAALIVYNENPAWVHGLPPAGTGLAQAEAIWMPLAKLTDPWRMDIKGTLEVRGFFTCRAFTIWINDGMSGAANVEYDISAGRFTITPITPSAMTVRITQTLKGGDVPCFYQQKATGITAATTITTTGLDAF